MYTLQNFIEDLPIQGLTILSRPADLSSIPVSSISAQELPLDAFVRENEIVLSTLTRGQVSAIVWRMRNYNK